MDQNDYANEGKNHKSNFEKELLGSKWFAAMNLKILTLKNFQNA